MNMNTPEGYVSLGLVGFTDKGNYLDTETYVKNDLVHEDNAIWQCLVDDSIGVNPRTDDTGHWKLWIDSENDASGITVIDNEGIQTEKGKETDLQDFIDAVADRVMNKLLTKAGLVNNGLATEAGVAALDAVMGKTLLDKIGDTANLPNGAADIVSALVAQNSNLNDSVVLINTTESKTQIIIRAWARAGVVTVGIIRSTSGNAQTGWYKIGQLPSGYAPIYSVTSYFMESSGTVLRMMVTTDGDVQVYSPSTGQIGGTLTYTI
jgi:hypothetical protein